MISISILHQKRKFAILKKHTETLRPVLKFITPGSEVCADSMYKNLKLTMFVNYCIVCFLVLWAISCSVFVALGQTTVLCLAVPFLVLISSVSW